MRDITLEDTFYHDFTTLAFATGIPTTLLGTPVLSVLEENNVTPITAGVSVSVDRASIVGLNMATIVATAANGYESGKTYSIYISTGTVDGVSVVGEIVGQFSIDKIEGLVWDARLTGSSHNVATSAGKRLRQIEESIVFASGTISVVTNGHTFTLDSGAVATADYYHGARLQIIEGTGAGQSRIIVGYTSGRVVTLDSDFIINPDTSSLYEIDSADVHVAVSDADLAEGFVATYTNTTTITLDAGAEATTDFYLGELIIFTHGAGAGQVREIMGYTSGRVVTMSPALITALDTTTTWHIQAAVSIAEIVDEAWDESQADHVASGSFGASLTEARLAKLGNLPEGIKKNSVLNNFAFLMVGSTDHVAGKTGLTFAAANFQRSIDGGAFANSSNVATEVSNGVYKVNLSAADLNGDIIVLRATGTDADDRIIVIKTEV